MVNITSCIEKIGAFEERLSVEIGSLRAVISDEADSDGDFKLQISGELTSSTGEELSSSISIVFAVYDDSNAIIKSKEIYVDEDDFMGLEIFDENLYVDSRNIQKIRIFPKKS